MKFKSKIYLSREVSNRLGLLAGRTALQPNLLCRIGFCLSLAEPGIPHLSDYLDSNLIKKLDDPEAALAVASEQQDQQQEEDKNQIQAAKDKAVAPKEFNRYTLTGEWEILFVALLRERCAKDGLDLEHDLEEQFAAHLSRGVLLLYDRVKSLPEIGRFFRYGQDEVKPELEAIF
jgi:DNA sulfur modification protein DndE